jgi:hypothetical protein
LHTLIRIRAGDGGRPITRRRADRCPRALPRRMRARSATPARPRQTAERSTVH